MGHNTCKSMGRVLCVVRRYIHKFWALLSRDRPRKMHQSEALFKSQSRAS